jgi:hypothetical protein
MTGLTPTLNLSTLVNTSVSADFTFQNTGDATLTYTVSTAAAFTLVVDPTSGSVEAGDTESVTVTATCGATPGTQSGTATVTTNGGNGTVTVNLTCEASDPEFSGPTPTSLSLEAVVNNSDTGTFSFQNTGNDTLTYTISTAAAFTLTTTPDIGSVSVGGIVNVTVTATCSGTAGTQSGTVTITTNDTDNPSDTVTVNLTCNTSAFDIDLAFSGVDFTAPRQQVFQNAATRLEGLITGDLPDFVLNKGDNACGQGDPAVNRTVDDVEIFAKIEFIDGVNGILGQAGPCLVRTANGLTVYGTMTFDSADIASLEASPADFEATILHEMMHVLGLGTLWELDLSPGGITIDLLDYVTNPGGQNCNSATGFSTPPSFTGANANGEYASLGGAGNIPVEDEFGAGTQCGHWDEGRFGTELMTGFLNAGSTNALSRMTVASFQDLGYSVFTDGADAYSIPACSPTCLKTQGVNIAEQEILLSPKGAVGPDGEITFFNHADHNNHADH